MYDQLLAIGMDGTLEWRMVSPILQRIQTWNQRTEEGAPWVEERMAYLRDYGRHESASLADTPRASSAERDYTATTSFGEGLLKATRKSSRS